LKTDSNSIIGSLAIGVTNHQLLKQQRTSWSNQLIYLKDHLQHLPSEWCVILEYPIPRRSKRIDIVILAHDLIFIIEYKDKETRYTVEAVSQVEDYALDIRDFHRQSVLKTVVPIVWASEGKEKNTTFRMIMIL
jgi:hypothetical protein